MSTTPTLRDAAQAAYELLSSGLGIPDAKYRVVTELAAALTQGAGAVEPVAYMTASAAKWIAAARSANSNITTTIYKTADKDAPVAIYLAPPAKQLQQAVARALDEAADFILNGEPPQEPGRCHIEIGKGARQAYAAAIRAKGTHD